MRRSSRSLAALAAVAAVGGMTGCGSSTTNTVAQVGCKDCTVLTGANVFDGTPIPESYAADPLRDVQVITPLRDRGELSCKALNAMFQEKLNPSPPEKGCRFKVGDKVIQTRNRYDLEILNGDIGFVREVAPERATLVVRFDNPDRMVELPVRDNELELAYAITCHKFQGSEAPIVVVPLHPSMGRYLLQRSWLYTAVSRAQRVCVLVGQRGVVRQAIAHNPQQHRYSNLAGQLQ